MSSLSLQRFWRSKPPESSSVAARSAFSGQERGKSILSISFLERYAVRLLWGVLVLGLLTGGVGLVDWLVQRPYFQIHHTVITGSLHQVDRALVLKSVQRIQGGLFTADLGVMATELRGIPWVRSVRLRRIWPDTLEVQVEEQDPVAYWGEEGLLNRQGEPFNAEYLGELPHFEGPPDRGAEMLDAWHRFNHLLHPIDHHVEEMTLTERGSWTLVLEDDTRLIMGKDGVEQRLQRLVEAWPALRQNGAIPPGSTLDLRYANGLAVRLPGTAAQGRS